MIRIYWNENHIKVADGAAFWRENDNLLKLFINDAKFPTASNNGCIVVTL